MKNVVASFALCLLFTTTGQAQSTNSNFRPDFNKEQLVAFNFPNSNDLTPFISNISNTIVTALVPVADAIESFSTVQFKYAMILDVEAESVTNAELFNFIDDWYGTRYRLGGTTKKGIDCSAFSSQLLASVFSLSLPRTAHEQYKMCEHLKKEDLMAGDLVFFNTTGGVSHVGVYLANNHFVHSCSSQGVMISSLDDAYFSKRFIGGGRVNQ